MIRTIAEQLGVHVGQPSDDTVSFPLGATIGFAETAPAEMESVAAAAQLAEATRSSVLGVVRAVAAPVVALANELSIEPAKLASALRRAGVTLSSESGSWVARHENEKATPAFDSGSPVSAYVQDLIDGRVVR